MLNILPALWWKEQKSCYDWENSPKDHSCIGAHVYTANLQLFKIANYIVKVFSLPNGFSDSENSGNNNIAFASAT